MRFGLKTGPQFVRQRLSPRNDPQVRHYNLNMYIKMLRLSDVSHQISHLLLGAYDSGTTTAVDEVRLRGYFPPLLRPRFSARPLVSVVHRLPNFGHFPFFIFCLTLSPIFGVRAYSFCHML